MAMNEDENFVEQMATQIDGLWSEYAADVHQVAFAQKQFEEELERREREQAEMARQHLNSQREGDVLNIAEMAGADDTICVDRMAFSNFVASNKMNDFTEDDTMHCIDYLRDDSLEVMSH